MADGFTFDVGMTSNKKEYLEALDDIAEKVLTMWGMQASSAAALRAPVDTGLLRNSIAYAIAGGTADKATYKAESGDGTGGYSGSAPADGDSPRHVYIGSNVEYAMSQETGNFHDGPHAFLRPAIDENRDYFKNILEEELKKALNNE